MTPWTAACQASLSFTISWNLLRLTLGKETCWTQATSLKVHLSQRHTETPKVMSGCSVAQSSWHKMNHFRVLSDHICQFLMLFMSCGWGRGHSESGIAQKLRTLLPPLSYRMTSEHWERTPETEIYTIQEGKHLFENTNLPPTQTWGRQVLWESQFLGRLIRSLGSLRRRKGPGALKEEIGVWNSQEGGKNTRLSFFLHSLVLVT